MKDGGRRICNSSIREFLWLMCLVIVAKRYSYTLSRMRKTGLCFLTIYVLRRFLSRGFRALLACYNGTPLPSHDIHAVDNVKIEDDGMPTLLNTVYFPTNCKASECKHPVILVRTPYYRMNASHFGHRFVEQGYICVIQDVRGRYGSDGEFNFLQNEHIDGVRTLRWLKKQEWFDGNVGMFGISYLGICAWAAISGLEEFNNKDECIPKIKAIMPIFTASDTHHAIYPDNSFALDMNLRFSHLIHRVGGEGDVLAKSRPKKPNILSLLHFITGLFPLQDGKVKRAAKEFAFPEMLKHFKMPQAVPYAASKNSEFWKERIFTPSVEETPPTHIIGGWYDVFLRGTLKDFERLQVINEKAKDIGQTPRHKLTIGPWHHFESLYAPTFRLFLQDGIKLFDEQLKGKTKLAEEKPVRIFVMDNKTKGYWKEFEFWPPPAINTSFYLHPDGKLQENKRCTQHEHGFSVYRYDPRDPTPSIGGAVFHPTKAGIVLNGSLEARHDVLLFTTSPLREDCEFIGPVKLNLYARSSTGVNVDFYGKLCDVHPNGESYNICDGLTRVQSIIKRSQSCIDLSIVTNTDEPALIEVDLWSTAKIVRKNHRLRLLISSGAHPRWIRNYGTGVQIDDSNLTEEVVKVANIEIFHSEKYPSSVILPITSYAQESSETSIHSMERKGTKFGAAA